MAEIAASERHAEGADRHPLALSPFRIGAVETPNRIFMGAHGLRNHFIGRPSGALVPTANCVAYYEERAAGGVGLIMHSFAVSGGLVAGPVTEAEIPAYAALADAVHRHGAKVFAQLWLSEDVGAWDALGPPRPLRGASGVPHFGRPDVGRAIPEAIVRSLAAPLGMVARNLAAAGYDGVEVHAAHGHLIEQFLSPYFNLRSDRYGGDRTGRLTLLIEVLEAVRKGFGTDGAVGMRFNPDEMLPGGVDEAEARAMLDIILDRGLVDFVNLGMGVAPRVSSIKPHPVEPLHERGQVERVGAVVRGRAVVLANPGRVTSLETAEELIASGVCDLVGMVRGLIAEPRLVKNAREGRPDRNRICVAGNVCSVVTGQGALYCELNPAVGREASWGELAPAPDVEKGKVVIVGAGPAGLEAARVAARSGHKVVLLERSNGIGGQLAAWAMLPGRAHRAGTIAWYRRELDAHGVEVRLGAEATAGAILGEAPDAVVLATGAAYDRQGRSGWASAPIPGWDRPIVLAPEDVIFGRRTTGYVVVYDEEGLHAGAGVAELLAGAGAKVEYVTTAVQVARSLVASGEAALIADRLRLAGVEVVTGAAVSEIGDRHALIARNGLVERLSVDAVVLVGSRVATSTLDLELSGRVRQLYVIGDALAPRTLGAAAYEGQRFARLIGRPGAPATTDDALMAPGDPSMAARPAA
jgi:2,4-dienoyl-CoA reductase-like NADH-dependent reductase (Old Yellow Enzyme family)